MSDTTNHTVILDSNRQRTKPVPTLEARTQIALLAAAHVRACIANGWTRQETVSGYVLTPPAVIHVTL